MNENGYGTNHTFVWRGCGKPRKTSIRISATGYKVTTRPTCFVIMTENLLIKLYLLHFVNAQNSLPIKAKLDSSNILFHSQALMKLNEARHAGGQLHQKVLYCVDSVAIITYIPKIRYTISTDDCICQYFIYKTN